MQTLLAVLNKELIFGVCVCGCGLIGVKQEKPLKYGFSFDVKQAFLLCSSALIASLDNRGIEELDLYLLCVLEQLLNKDVSI